MVVWFHDSRLICRTTHPSLYCLPHALTTKQAKQQTTRPRGLTVSGRLKISSGHLGCNAVHNPVGEFARSALIAGQEDLAVAYAGQAAYERFEQDTFFHFHSMVQRKSPARLCLVGHQDVAPIIALRAQPKVRSDIVNIFCQRPSTYTPMASMAWCPCLLHF